MIELVYCDKNNWWKVNTFTEPITTNVLHALKNSGFHAYVDGHMGTHALIIEKEKTFVNDVEQKTQLITNCFYDEKQKDYN